MSVKVMGRVWDSSLEPRMRYVLLAYADAAEHDGSQIWPGQSRLRKMTGYSRATIERITAELLSRGVLRQVGRGHAGQRAEFSIDLHHPTLNVSQDETHQADPDPAESVSQVRPSSTQEGSQGETHYSVRSVSLQCKVCLKTGKVCLTCETPPVLTSRPTTPVLEEVVADAPTRPRDLVWEIVTQIHGDPATASERGKLNKVRAKLREANVGDVEYPQLVAAYMAKYTKRGSEAPQPTAMTIAERVGELRHFITRGPIGSPAGNLDDLAAARERQQVTAELEDEYGTDALPREVSP